MTRKQSSPGSAHGRLRRCRRSASVLLDSMTASVRGDACRGRHGSTQSRLLGDAGWLPRSGHQRRTTGLGSGTHLHTMAERRFDALLADPRVPASIPQRPESRGHSSAVGTRHLLQRERRSNASRRRQRYASLIFTTGLQQRCRFEDAAQVQRRVSSRARAPPAAPLRLAQRAVRGCRGPNPILPADGPSG